MKINEYLGDFFKEFLAACGFLTIVSAVFFEASSKDAIITSMFWQIIIGASVYSFFKFAFTNKYNFQKKLQLMNFTIFSALADIMIILWLYLFSTNRFVNRSLIAIYIIAILGAKAFVYVMMYINDKTQAKQINEKLKDYKNNNE